MDLHEYRHDLQKESGSILQYWTQYSPDPEKGGFYGEIDSKNRPTHQAPKALVLNSRILWTFSAAYARNPEALYLQVAGRAYEYLLDHFMDAEYEGAYWSVDHNGVALKDYKQTYGLAFCIYGLSEYFIASGEKAALDRAIRLFRLIEQYSYDTHNKGYYEAFTRDWLPMKDLWLTPQDSNAKMSMNTHLHLVEAYANLYRAWPDALLKQRITGLLEVFDEHIIDHFTGHLFLFFDEHWTSIQDIVSYGHDIEAAWLLQRSAEIVKDPHWIDITKKWSLKTALAAAEGLDSDGGLWYEKNMGCMVREKHWWPQAEAMIGFLNAWEVTGDEQWMQRSLFSWTFVRDYIKDPLYGEWHSAVMADQTPMTGQCKVGSWKCPYHNSRACLEVIKRIQKHIPE